MTDEIEVKVKDVRDKPFQLDKVIDDVRQHDVLSNELKAKSDAEREIAQKKIKSVIIAEYVEGPVNVDDPGAENEYCWEIKRMIRGEFDNVRHRVRKEVSEADLDPILKRAKKGVVAFSKLCRKSKRTLIAVHNKNKYYVSPRGLGVTSRVVANSIQEYDVASMMDAANSIADGLRAVKLVDEADTIEQLSKLWKEMGASATEDGMKISFPLDEPKEIVDMSGNIQKVKEIVLEGYGYPMFVCMDGSSDTADDAMQSICIYALVRDRLDSREKELRDQLRSAKLRSNEILEKIMELVGPYMLSQEL